MEKSEIIAGVAKDLYATEQAVDEAIAKAAALVQSMIDGRIAGGASPVAFAASQSKVIDVLASLGEARDAVVAAHQEMAKDHRRMGWGVYAAGPLDKPDDTQSPTGVAPLRIAS